MLHIDWEATMLVLSECDTLAKADKRLTQKRRAVRWGLFDGWHGRQESVSGLIGQGADQVHSEAAREYHEAYLLGMNMATSLQSG